MSKRISLSIMAFVLQLNLCSRIMLMPGVVLYIAINTRGSDLREYNVIIEYASEEDEAWFF